MKFFDSFKIALHNIRNNKSRSILTIIIVMIVSTLIMGLTTFGIMFNSNSLAINKAIFADGGTYMFVYGKDNIHSSVISNDELEKFEQIVDKYEVYIDNITFNGTANFNEISNINLVDFKHLTFNADNLITYGRIWNKDDSNSNNIWLSDTYVKNSALSGNNYTVGSDFVLNLTEYSDGKEPINKQIKAKVSGIYSYESLKKTTGYYACPDLFMDYRTYVKNCDESCIYDIRMSYLPPEVNYDYNAVYKQLKNMQDEMDDVFGYNVSSDGYKSKRFYCSIIETMEMNRLMGLLIMGVLILLSFIVLLLSIGSVANTMIISVDKNRKFIGLMKALGLNQKGVKRSISIESFLIISFGILLSVCILFFVVKPAILMALTKLFTQMYSFTKVKYEVISIIPLYIPFVTLFFFYFMAKFSSRGSLRKIASQDVISTISEVA